MTPARLGHDLAEFPWYVPTSWTLLDWTQYKYMRLQPKLVVRCPTKRKTYDKLAPSVHGKTPKSRGQSLVSLIQGGCYAILGLQKWFPCSRTWDPRLTKMWKISWVSNSGTKAPNQQPPSGSRPALICNIHHWSFSGEIMDFHGFSISTLAYVPQSDFSVRRMFGHVALRNPKSMDFLYFKTWWMDMNGWHHFWDVKLQGVT